MYFFDEENQGMTMVFRWVWGGVWFVNTSRKFCKSCLFDGEKKQKLNHMDVNPLFRKKPVALIMKDAAGGEKETQMRRNLSVTDLTAFGIAAIVGAGIFSTIGTAASSGGPAVSLLFVFTALACGFSAMSYAEFASSIPISGSAYTYAYASFGELVAWIIGWDLIMEYAVGNIAVAISWSGYFTGLMT